MGPGRGGSSCTGAPTRPWSTACSHRAEAAAAEAVVVTLDTTMLGWRPQDLDLGSLPFAQGTGIAQYTSDPRFREVVAERLAPRRAGGRRRPGSTPRRGPHAALDQRRHYPGTLRAQPALPGAAGRRRDLPRHLLQPVAELGRPGHVAGADAPAHRAQGNPAPRRRAPGRSTSGSTPSSSPTTAAGRSTGRSPHWTRCPPSRAAVGDRAWR